MLAFVIQDWLRIPGPLPVRVVLVHTLYAEKSKEKQAKEVDLEQVDGRGVLALGSGRYSPQGLDDKGFRIIEGVGDPVA
jgi:hypothetical protein